MVDLIELLDEVSLLSCLASIFFYITYLIIELISVVIFCLLWFSPSHREIFLIKCAWLSSMHVLGVGTKFSFCVNSI
jgi:hypothetical protein